MRCCHCDTPAAIGLLVLNQFQSLGQGFQVWVVASTIRMTTAASR